MEHCCPNMRLATESRVEIAEDTWLCLCACRECGAGWLGDFRLELQDSWESNYHRSSIDVYEVEFNCSSLFPDEMKAVRRGLAAFGTGFGRVLRLDAREGRTEYCLSLHGYLDDLPDTPDAISTRFFIDFPVEGSDKSGSFTVMLCFFSSCPCEMEWEMSRRRPASGRR